MLGDLLLQVAVGAVLEDEVEAGADGVKIDDFSDGRVAEVKHYSKLLNLNGWGVVGGAYNLEVMLAEVVERLDDHELVVTDALG
jgi:hypothetical protein